MNEKPTAEDIYDQAALWAAKVDAGPLAPVEQSMLDAWLDAANSNLPRAGGSQSVANRNK